MIAHSLAWVLMYRSFCVGIRSGDNDAVGKSALGTGPWHRFVRKTTARGEFCERNEQDTADIS